MLTIQLHNLQFHSFHGIYEEEKKLGNRFEVNATIRINVKEKILHLHQSVDYVKACELVTTCMNRPTPLLETVAENIIEQLHRLDGRIFYASVSIKKLHPPITGIQGSVGISVEKDFNNI